MDRKNLDEVKLREIFTGYECSHSDRITEIFKKYRTNDYIYPSVLGRNLKVSMQQSIEILDMLVAGGMAVKCFQYYCRSCGMPQGEVLIEEVEEDVFCPSCDSPLDKNDKRYVYKCL